MDIKIEKIKIGDQGKKEWFDRLVNNAYVNGWTYSSCTDEIWNDYVNRWNHFVDYLEKLKVYEGKVRILIGEAPPFYRATKRHYEKAYFYSVDETGNSPWFSAPLAYFVEKNKLKAKGAKLNALAEKGVVLLDIFPFPIIQDTEMRMDITGAFAAHLESYFVHLVKSVLDFVESKNKVDSKSVVFQWGITATKYAGTQLMLGENSRAVMIKCIENIFESPIDGIDYKDKLQFYEEHLSPSYSEGILNIPNYTVVGEKKVYSPFFLFVVTLLYANKWMCWMKKRKEVGKRYSQKVFVKHLLSIDNGGGNVTLKEINALLNEMPILPIFSTDKGRISMLSGNFFNAKE